MKIITWNCNGAFRKKFESLLTFDADIIVVQECENPNETKDKDYKKWAENYLWSGDSKNKGIGIFAKKHIKLQKLQWSDYYNDNKVKHFLPSLINDEIQVLAVWTHQNNSPTYGYIGQFWKYLQVNKHQFSKTIIIGDFNSNSIWDKQGRLWNHSRVVNELQEIGIESAYHKNTNEKQGEELIPTFYLHRKNEKPYHIDYCFASKEIIDCLININIEPFEKWNELSDHSPLVIDFDL